MFRFSPQVWLLALSLWFLSPALGRADDGAAPAPAPAEDKIDRGDTAWMLASSGLVLLMVPGLALFYGGMVRRKNVLATMMHSMVALSIVGVLWIAVGYALAFGSPILSFSGGGLLGWDSQLVFLRGIEPTRVLPNASIPVYLHVMFQGMFAIITPALISGALAERIRFKPYCVFIVVWLFVVYCPIAHWVWAMDWWTPIKEGSKAGKTPVGWLGALGALDFAGGTVVHIGAGLSGLAAILALRKRFGYPGHAMHPNSMVLTLIGTGLLWFGWFGFNGGSGLGSGSLATSAFAATQAAAAAAGLSWLLAEWIHKGKPTALGLASGVVAGLVAVTPASGYVYPWGGLAIGLIAGVFCYGAVLLKPVFGYDDSLDAFGVHGVGGFLGAVLTGVFCFKAIQGVDGASENGLLAGNPGQVGIQFLAAAVTSAYAFVVSFGLVKLIDATMGFTTDLRAETEGLDQSEHGEAGFDLNPATESIPTDALTTPRAAPAPPKVVPPFVVRVEGASSDALLDAWSKLCVPATGPTNPDFRAVYPYMTTVTGNRFRFRGGEPPAITAHLRKLFAKELNSEAVRAQIEN